MRLKRLLWSLPLILGVIFLTAYLLAKPYFYTRPNDLIVNLGADANKLNPILADDSASLNVAGLIFNGLVKYDQNLNLVGDLAENWDVSQDSSFFLKPDSGLTADAAVVLLNDNLSTDFRTEFKPINIQALAPDRVGIYFNSGGGAYHDAILALIPTDKIDPVKLVPINLDVKVNFPDGTPCNATNVAAALKIAFARDLALARRILEYEISRSDSLVIHVRSDEASVLKIIKSTLPEKAGEVGNIDANLFRDEPLLTFHLRHGVKFHDGTDFTSRDVRFLYDKVMDENTLTVRRSDFELVKDLQTPDPYTVVVRYKQPYAPAVSIWAYGIMSAETYSKDKNFNESYHNRHPIGTGPFQFDRWKTAQYIRLKAFPDYFEGKPQLSAIVYRILPEPALAGMEFQSHGLDEHGIQPWEQNRFKNDPNVTIYSRPADVYSYIGWNLTLDIFKDVRVRRALTMAINREQIVKYVHWGMGHVSNGIFTPTMWACDTSIEPLPYDPQQSRRLLAQAGWRDTDGDGVLDKNGIPFKFRLTYNSNNEQRKNIAEVVQRELDKLNIKAEIIAYEWQVFREKVEERDFEACVMGWALGGDPDPYQIWHSSQRGKKKGFNFVNYVNPEVDRLIELQRTELDQEKRKTYLFKIQRLIHDDQPYTFLVVPEAATVMYNDAFLIRRPDPNTGRDVTLPITMTKAGLDYYIREWFRTHSVPELQD